MNENRRLLIVGIVIIALVAIVLLAAFWPEADKSFVCGVKADGNYKKLGSVNYKQYQCLIKQKSKTALVFSNKMTNKKKKVLNAAATKIGNVIYYIDNNSINKKDLKVIKKKLKYQKKSFEKDVVLVINNGKIDTYKENILININELKEFLTNAKLAKFICNAKPNEEYENLGVVDYEGYNCLYESDQPFAIVLSQTTCGYCKKFKPVINDYVAKNNLPIYIIEINLLSQDELNALKASLSYFDNNESWGTPLTLGIKNKEVVANMSGFTENEEEIDEFFDTLGLK